MPCSHWEIKVYKDFSGKESTGQCRRCRFYPLEQEMATHSNILAWEIPWTEEPGRPCGYKRARHDWVTKHRHHHHQRYTKHLAKSKRAMDAAVSYCDWSLGAEKAFLTNCKLVDVHEVRLMLGYHLCCHWFQKVPKNILKLWPKKNFFFFLISP